MEVNIRPRLSHSNSFGNDAEKDTAGCRALDRKYIVIGGDTHTRHPGKSVLRENHPQRTRRSDLADAMDWAEQCEEKLTALLEGEEKILLLRLLNAENEISSTIALENFILGFRLGMRIAMESLGEDAGSLTMYREEG